MAFADLYGNERVKNILSSYLNNNIIPYSIIFFGPGSADLPGFAIAFVKAMNCLQLDNDFCDKFYERGDQPVSDCNGQHAEDVFVTLPPNLVGCGPGRQHGISGLLDNWRHG